jgi:hypothetical protein
MPASGDRGNPVHKFVEIRTYNIEPGQRDEFHVRMHEGMLPLLKKQAVDVVACRASPQDECSYYLIRAYDSIDHSKQSQETLYDSRAWKEGPREALLELIDSYMSIIIEMDEVTIQGLRTPPS